MMFLILKMFAYLVLAAAIGLGAGWLLRNLQAQQREEQARRSVTDAKSKLPQLESLLRGRDDQITKLKGEIKERRQENKDLLDEIKNAEKSLLEQRRETNKWKQSAESKAPLDSALSDEKSDESNEAADDNGSNADEIIAELSQEISALRARLSETRKPEANGADTGHNEEALMAELDATRLQNSQLEKALSAAQADLERQREVAKELERERDLQNKSLTVLHQQLELERSRVAGG